MTNVDYELTYFWPVFPFYTPGDIKWEHWPDMGEQYPNFEFYIYLYARIDRISTRNFCEILQVEGQYLNLYSQTTEAVAGVVL